VHREARRALQGSATTAIIAWPFSACVRVALAGACAGSSVRTIFWSSGGLPKARTRVEAPARIVTGPASSTAAGGAMTGDDHLV
jgi:hypothetical protein